MEWLHKIREENYIETRDKNLVEVIKDSVKRTKGLLEKHRN